MCATPFLDDPIEVVGMMDFLPSPSLHLFEGRTCIFVPTPVVPKDPSRGIGHPGELRHMVGQRPKPLFAFRYRLACLHLSGDVPEIAHDAVAVLRQKDAVNLPLIALALPAVMAVLDQLR